MKNAFVAALLTVSMFTGAEVSAQGKGKPKKQKSQTVRVQQPVYGTYNGYGKNHGSYQGNGRKVGHYNKQRLNRPATPRDRNVVVQPQPRRSVWDIFSGR